jgi:hypothetical protein
MCAVCSARLRELYADNSCPLCKGDVPNVVYTRDPVRSFESFSLQSLKSHAPFHMYFDDADFFTALSATWRFDCPFADTTVGAQYATFGARNTVDACASRFPALKPLRAHVQKVHGMVYCSLCVTDRHVFLHEQLLYTPAALKQHTEEGERAAADEAAVAGNAKLRRSIESLGGTPQPPPLNGHPMCNFCETRQYGTDQLFAHMRDRHETCHLCEKAGQPIVYYQNYMALEVHFSSQHYLCADPACREKTFVVFSTDVALQAHMNKQHTRSNKLELNFSYKSSAPAISANNRAARGRGVDDDPPPTAASSSSSSSSSLATAAASTSNIGTAGANEEFLPQPPADEDELMQRNRALINQIKAALNEVQFDQFRRESGALRRGEMAPATYYARFCHLFTDSSAAPAAGLNARGVRLFRELVALLPDAALRERLTALHADAKRQLQVAQEFPSLDGSTVPNSGTWSGRLQRSQWNTGAPESPLAPEAFPTLGGGTAAPLRLRQPVPGIRVKASKWGKPNAVARLKK